jgi:uncharacterized protein with HEPN domain
MPPRDWRTRIEDMLDAIAKIAEYTNGMTLESFASDNRTVDAVVRNFTIIGEAARHVPWEIESRYPDLPWADMRDMRNVVVHEYFGVNLKILWETSQLNIPPLGPRLRDILTREPE